MLKRQNTFSSTIFVDYISLSSLVHVRVFGPTVHTIWHFEPISPSAQRLLRVFRCLGLIYAEIRQIEHHIGHVRNGDEEGEYFRLRGVTRTICSKIRREQLEKDPLIRAMSSEWVISKILLYFERLAEKTIHLECTRIGLAGWMQRVHLRIVSTQCALLIRNQPWSLYLEEYARSQGVQLLVYRPWELGKTVRMVFWPFRAIKGALVVVLNAMRYWVWSLARSGHSGKSLDESTAQAQRSAAKVGINYWGRRLSFEPTERSEFFWLNGSGIPYSEVLLYNYVSDKSLDSQTLEQIRASGITLFGQGPGIPAWVPTDQMFAVQLRTELKLILRAVTCLAHGQRVSFYFLRKLWKLARNYAYWYDFFSANRVRVNVGTLNTGVGQVLALNALGGISVAYQCSASAIAFPTTRISAGEDIQFVFSAAFERLWRSIGVSVGTLVQVGFIYDEAIEALHGLERIAEGRRQLQENGAYFILCFFDENSKERYDLHASHEDAANDYEFLLKWLLADPTLGIVFKPKISVTLFSRIGRVLNLIEQAKRTGRCRFLGSDTKVSSIFPAEAALMSDVCIGKLRGLSAALEARLAGVPTVMIDTQGYRSHPLRSWGHGRVVFDDWVSLHAAIERYRDAPEANRQLGDWTPGLNDLDPFRDGQAGLRMGLYVRWAYEALKAGCSKEVALAQAAERFAERWGKEYITSGTQTDPGVE